MASLMIAYGSNINKAQMRRRCPTARPLGKFLLRDARLVFRGVADLEYIAGAQVPCALWMINADDEAALDMYEGIATGTYFKTREIKIEYAGKRRAPVLYLMNSEGVYPPSQAYVDTIRQGYRDFKMNESFLDEAIRRSFLDKAPDEHTLARRLRQRAGKVHRELARRPNSALQPNSSIPSLFDQFKGT
jgi:AIG2-like family